MGMQHCQTYYRSFKWMQVPISSGGIGKRGWDMAARSVAWAPAEAIIIHEYIMTGYFTYSSCDTLYILVLSPYCEMLIHGMKWRKKARESH